MFPVTYVLNGSSALASHKGIFNDSAKLKTVRVIGEVREIACSEMSPSFEM